MDSPCRRGRLLTLQTKIIPYLKDFCKLLLTQVIINYINLFNIGVIYEQVISVLEEIGTYPKNNIDGQHRHDVSHRWFYGAFNNFVTRQSAWCHPLGLRVWRAVPIIQNS
ncbi:TPA: hypothetical protein DEP94_00760, partial [Candidatus Nomurabacteria bacterium]|nr:hypothetical protein [Candidatus Nomurabacteria bacterium]